MIEGTSRTEAMPEIDRGHGCRPLVDALVSDIAMRKERKSAFCLCCIVCIVSVVDLLIAQTRGFIDIHEASIHSRTLLTDYLEAPGCGGITLLLSLCSACELSDATASGQGRLDIARDAGLAGVARYPS